MIEIPQSTPRQARQSALVVAALFAAIGGWRFFRHGMTWAVIASAAAVAVVLACAVVQPAAMWFHRHWMMLGAALGYVNSRIILTLLFYGIVTPIGLAGRMFGYDALDRRGPREQSYWRARPVTRQSREGYERAF